MFEIMSKNKMVTVKTKNVSIRSIRT